MAKKPRGSYENVMGSTRDRNNVFHTRWKDNAVVTVASTNLPSQNSNTVNRWCKERRAKIDVTIPFILMFIINSWVDQIRWIIIIIIMVLFYLSSRYYAVSKEISIR